MKEVYLVFETVDDEPECGGGTYFAGACDDRETAECLCFELEQKARKACKITEYPNVSYHWERHFVLKLDDIDMKFNVAKEK